MTAVEAIESFADRKVGEIAASLPGATGVFREIGIDFCCHGDVRLAQAAEARGLDLRSIEAALSRLDDNAASPVPMQTPELIAHILERYHEVHRRQVPEMILLSQKVERVHAGKLGVPVGLADVLQQALGELEVHMRKEELILFPAMLRQGSGPLHGPIDQMRQDHSDHGEFLEQLVELTDNFTPPAGACGTWRALYAAAAQFRDDLIEHIHTENNILFPRFE